MKFYLPLISLLFLASCKNPEASKEAKETEEVEEIEKCQIEKTMDSLGMKYIFMDPVEIGIEGLDNSFGYGSFNLRFEFTGEISLPISKVEELRDTLMYVRKKWDEWDGVVKAKNLDDITKDVKYSPEYVTGENLDNMKSEPANIEFTYFSRNKKNDLESFVSMRPKNRNIYGIESVIFNNKSELDTFINAISEEKIMEAIYKENTKKKGAEELN